MSQQNNAAPVMGCLAVLLGWIVFVAGVIAIIWAWNAWS